MASWKIGDHEQRERNRLGRPMPPRPRVARMRIQAPGMANSANQPSPSGEVPLRVVRELVREHDLLLVLGERVEQHRVPEDDAARRPDPERVRVRLVGVVAHLLDADRDVSDAELRSILARRCERAPRPGAAPS